LLEKPDFKSHVELPLHMDPLGIEVGLAQAGAIKVVVHGGFQLVQLVKFLMIV